RRPPRGPPGDGVRRRAARAAAAARAVLPRPRTILPTGDRRRSRASCSNPPAARRVAEDTGGYPAWLRGRGLAESGPGWPEARGIISGKTGGPGPPATGLA